VRAYWCETYDENGTSRRAGAYWELYPDGATRALARYVDSQIEGPVEVFNEDGSLWLRGELVGGSWTGPLEIFHANGVRWLSAQFRAGQLDGPVETRFPDGRLESSTRFQGGHEDGVATSYFPQEAGGGLRSRVRVEADEIVESLPRPTSRAALSPAALPDAPLLHAEN
jgi:antitoxin component YwqK of YwqJK toxin-antitoxin module